TPPLPSSSSSTYRSIRGGIYRYGYPNYIIEQSYPTSRVITDVKHS
ncbi:unnamed protein product, partial [Rotaria sp. Silwood2]